MLRARQAKALRSERRGRQLIREEASLRADLGIAQLTQELSLSGGDAELHHAAQSDSGKRQ